MIAGVLGWLGAIGTFVAYLLVARGNLSSESTRYAALNAVGGTLGCAASALYGAWGSAFSNGMWAAVGVHALVMAVTRRTSRTPVLALPEPEPDTDPQPERELQPVAAAA